MDFKHHLEQKGAKSDDGEREDDEYDEEGAFRGGLDDDEGAESLRMSQVDWLRRGQLCERLGRVEDAERAYRVCVHDDANFTAWWGYRRTFYLFLFSLRTLYNDVQPTITSFVKVLSRCPNARSSLARIYVGFGWTEEALNSLFYALEVLEHPRAKDGRVPSVVQNTLRALVAKVGLQAVRDAQLKNSRKDSHPEVDTLLHDVVKWHVSGWDR